MKETGLTFMSDMVLAIKAGRKWQTRRLVARPTVTPSKALGVRIETGCDDCWRNAVPHNGEEAALGGPCYLRVDACEHVGPKGYPGGGRIRPRWDVGDRLWVREAIYYAPEHSNFYYSADHAGVGNENYFKLLELRKASIAAGRKPGKVRQASHMPRFAARFFLEVTSVRVERLHDITEADAIAEGVDIADSNPHVSIAEPHALMYAVLWDQINGDRASFDSNPWVWRIAFTPWPGRS